MNTPKRKAFEPLNLNSSAKRARINLTLDQKRSICKYHRENPKASHETIAKHFTTFFNLQKQIGRSTISDIVRNKENWKGLTNDSSIDFLNDSFAHHIPISDEMYIEQAMKIGDDIEVNRQEFNYSKDASADVDEAELESGRTTLNENDRFILDKLAIIFRLQSNKTSSNKKSADEIKSEFAEEFPECDSPEDIACKLLKQKETIEFSVEKTQKVIEDNDFEKFDCDLTQPKVINTAEALIYINKVEAFFVNSPFTDENDLEMVNKLRSRIEVINEQS